MNPLGNLRKPFLEGVGETGRTGWIPVLRAYP